MALSFKEINSKKNILKEKQEKGDQRRILRPWEEKEKEVDLLEAIALSPKKRHGKMVYNDFKKIPQPPDEKKSKKKLELERNKQRGVTDEMKKKLKKLSKDYFGDL